MVTATPLPVPGLRRRVSAYARRRSGDAGERDPPDARLAAGDGGAHRVGGGEGLRAGGPERGREGEAAVGEGIVAGQRGRRVRAAEVPRPAVTGDDVAVDV